MTEEKRALRFGQKCKDESRSRGREKAVFGLEEGEAAYSWLFTRAHTHTHTHILYIVWTAHVYRDGIQDRVSIHLASLTKFRVYLLAWPVAGACAILILRSKFSTLRPATLLSCLL